MKMSNFRLTKDMKANSKNATYFSVILWVISTTKTLEYCYIRTFHTRQFFVIFFFKLLSLQNNVFLESLKNHKRVDTSKRFFTNLIKYFLAENKYLIYYKNHCICGYSAFVLPLKSGDLFTEERLSKMDGSVIIMTLSRNH